jgi:hypothetical protein
LREYGFQGRSGASLRNMLSMNLKDITEGVIRIIAFLSAHAKGFSN